MRRTERLFAIVEHLRGRRSGTTAEALAERFGVSDRTMYRDLDGLRGAELPLLSERGRGGGYALDRGYTLPPVNFTAREAAVLLAAGRSTLQLRRTPFLETLTRALDKIAGALPPPSQREAESLRQDMQIVGVPAQTPSREVREVVERAWFERAPMEIVYEGARETTVRRVRLRSVVLDATEILLNCDDLDKSEPRQFRFHAIRSARVLPPVAAAMPVRTPEVPRPKRPSRRR